MTRPEVFIHVGTGKTGTTFLQYRVFPYLKGIKYIQRTRYKKAEAIIRSGKFDRLFFSREFDRQMEAEVKAFSAYCPWATPLVVFRRHDSYIASQYRRFTKNGFGFTIQEFLDLEDDQGYFRRQHLCYMEQVDLLRRHFQQEPIVMIYEDMRRDPQGFIRKLAELTGTTVEVEKLNLRAKHRSYNEQQLKGVVWLGKYINIRKRRMFRSEALNLLGRLYLSILRYSTLYVAKWLPASWFDPAPLIEPAQLDAVKDFFAEDWKAVRELAAKI